jgi:hypothetical protein
MAEQTPPRRRPIPNWYYAVGAAGVAVVFFLYRRNQQSKAAAAAQAAGMQGITGTAYSPVPASPAVSGQDLGTLLSYITQAQGQPAQVVSTPTTTTPSSTTTSTNTPPRYEQALGNGQAGTQVLDIIGQIVGPSTYQGYNVAGGAPVFSYINGQWTIGTPWAQIPVGTKLAVPTGSAPNIQYEAGVVTEHLG